MLRAHRASGHLPLGDGARLRWLGISEDFVPLTVGSAGMLAHDGMCDGVTNMNSRLIQATKLGWCGSVLTQ